MVKNRIIPEQITEKLRKRFKYYSKTQTDNGCIEWGARIGVGGYGVFKIKSHPFYAHRVAYYLATGIDPGVFVVMHSCDNRNCVNPDHLILGTQKDNSQDMVKKGRQVKKENHWTNTSPDKIRMGEKISWHKVTERDVREIRASEKPLAELAKEYGICFQNVSMIKNRKTWRHI